MENYYHRYMNLQNFVAMVLKGFIGFPLNPGILRYHYQKCQFSVEP